MVRPLVSGAKDGGVKLWATHRQKKDDVLPGDWQPLAFSRDSRTLAALDARGDSVAFLNLATREPEKLLALEPTRFRFGPAVALSDDLSTLAQGLSDGGVKLWNTETLDAQTLPMPDWRTDLVALSPAGF